MEKLTKDISGIIITDLKNLNNKVRGLNFLELLKTNIIEKLFQLVSKQKFPFEQTVSYENEIKEDSRNIKILINYFLNSTSISKKVICNDSLFISFNEGANLDIYEDEKHYTSILLYKNSGISLPKDTVINLKNNKNLLLIEIANIETDQILTKKKKI